MSAIGHHNFQEYFILDPFAEPDLDQATKDELKEKNIKLLYAQAPYVGDDSSVYNGIFAIGFDDHVRPLGTAKLTFSIPLPGGEFERSEGGGGFDPNVGSPGNAWPGVLQPVAP